MATQQQKFDYLDEHLPFMLGQLRYDFAKINEVQYFRDWNSYFQSYSVNARNLVQFLDNADKGNFKATDFVVGFRHRKGEIQGALQRLRDQVFHLGKGRPRDKNLKFDSNFAAEVFAWIQDGMQDFTERLSPDDRKAWNAQKADPQFDKTTPSAGSASPPSASSSILVSSAHTSSLPSNVVIVRNA
jgi:hypothetical protein